MFADAPPDARVFRAVSRGGASVRVAPGNLYPILDRGFVAPGPVFHPSRGDGRIDVFPVKNHYDRSESKSDALYDAGHDGYPVREFQRGAYPILAHVQLALLDAAALYEGQMNEPVLTEIPHAERFDTE